MPLVSDLPYDVLREIFISLSAVDVLNFLRTARKLYYPLINDDSTWYIFCARYGITNTSVFRRRSFRTIYGRLLHRYGPLIGLWCSDYPFYGNIVQFRIVPDRWLRGGEPIIVGDVWEFKHPDGAPVDAGSHYPKYTEFMQVGFVPWKKSTLQTANDVQISWHVRSERNLGFLVHNGIPPPWVRMDGDGRLATPSFHVIAPTNMTVDIAEHYDSSVSLPEIVSSLPWYDPDRGVPRLTQEGPPPFVKQTHRWYYRSTTLHYITGEDKPASIAFFPPPLDKESDVRIPTLHNPPGGYDMTSRTFEGLIPRYYPVRFHIQTGVDPASPRWTPDSVVGLWLGDYGPHGTECLYVEHDAAKHMLRAWKLIGDINVPRGACSWDANLQQPLPEGDPKRRAFAGQGTLAQRGFVRAHKMDLRVTLAGRDEIIISWGPEHDIKFTRYTTTRGRVGEA